LLKIAPSLLEGKSPALVVVVIGTNDAYATPGREQQFSEAYAALLHRLAVIVPNLVVANIPPVDPKGRLMATGIDASLIDRYNLILPKLAEGARASFIDLNKAISAEGASLRLQYALRQRARELGWHEADIDVIDADLGLSGAGASHRQGFKDLVARVTLGEAASSCRSRSRGWRATARIGTRCSTYAVIAAV
jgi:hypothetical protein